MTIKCTFCNDTKQEPGIPGPCVWCEDSATATLATLASTKTAKVTDTGVGFGNAWFSHESITGYTAEQLNSNHCRVTGKAYMDWLSSAENAPAFAGFKLVPVEPTKEMIEAAKRGQEYPNQLHALRNPQITYAAMLAAAPVPPQVEAQPVATAFGWVRFDDGQKAIFTRSKRTKDSEPVFLHPTAYRVTHSDAGEVERLRESERKCIASADAQHLRAVNAERERDTLRAQLAKMGLAFKKLRDVAHGCYQIASSYSGCIDGVEEHGGDDHEDPSCAIHHRLYYAMFDADAALSATKEGK